MPRVRVRVRAKARMREKPRPKPKAEAECLEEIRSRRMTGWDLLTFLYDCIKRAREREERR